MKLRIVEVPGVGFIPQIAQGDKEYLDPWHGLEVDKGLLGGFKGINNIWWTKEYQAEKCLVRTKEDAMKVLDIYKRSKELRQTKVVEALRNGDIKVVYEEDL